MADHTIAIVDDHPLFRDALRESLKTALASLETVVAGSLEELNALLGEDRDIDLVLLDLNMPGVQGFSGLLYLRAQYPHLPVAIVSASEDPGGRPSVAPRPLFAPRHVPDSSPAARLSREETIARVMTSSASNTAIAEA